MSYKYSDHRFYIDKDLILEKVSQEEIFEFAYGIKVELYKNICSPIRENDTRPKCYFEYYGDTLHFVDWGSNRVRSDCFNAVQDAFKISFYKSLLVINEYFDLGIGQATGLPTPKKNKPLSITREPKVVKNFNKIEVKTRKFNNTTDKSFWSNRYQISLKNLEEDNVFPIVWYKVFSKRMQEYVTIRPNTRSYAIYSREGDRFKIYTPDAKGRGKFVTNCVQNDIGSIDSLTYESENLVITKSYKDCRVLRNFGIESIWLQNEGMTPDDDILFPVIQKYNKVFIFFDNDQTGLNTSFNLAEHINRNFENKAFSITLPLELLKFGIKDPSDLIHRKGKEPLKHFLDTKNLLNN